MTSDSDESVDLTLSNETFAALQEFYDEQDKQDATHNIEISSGNLLFQEDWQLSQFWYNEETIEKLTKIIANTIGTEGSVALISCPSLYKKVSERCTNVKLFEFDQRFRAFGNDFIFYDYNTPLAVPEELARSFDLVVADPPYLSEACLTNTAVTIKYLTKEKIILCTGATMESFAKRILKVDKTTFEPRHRNNLGNEFCCYTNFCIDDKLM